MRLTIESHADGPRRRPILFLSHGTTLFSPCRGETMQAAYICTIREAGWRVGGEIEGPFRNHTRYRRPIVFPVFAHPIPSCPILARAALLLSNIHRAHVIPPGLPAISPPAVSQAARRGGSPCSCAILLKIRELPFSATAPPPPCESDRGTLLNA